MIFSRRKTIGVFITKTFAVFDNAFLHALDSEGKRLDYDIVVYATVGYYLTQSDYDVQEKNIFRFAAIEKLDGIIVVPESYERGEFRELLYGMLRRARCPVVAVRDDNCVYDCVYTDEREAIRPLVRHLIEDHGLRRICFQTGFPGHAESEARLEVFRQEMEAHGLSVDEDDVCPGNMWSNCGEAAYARFFSDPERRPEAVVCANDYMAVGLMRELKKHNLRVPEDVIVTGFDNIPELGVDVPSLTTVQPDYAGMVTRAMNHLDRQIKGGWRPKGQTRLPLNGRFVLGESCGCGRRSPEYFRQVSQKTTHLLELENDQDAMMNNMSIDLGACDDLTELHGVMISPRCHNPILRDHYLCLFGTPDALMEEEGEQACLVHAIRDGRDCGMPMVTFDRVNLLPPMAERPDEPQMLYVKLLHQNRHNFGYSVFHYEAGEVPSRTYVQTNALMSIALANIYRRKELMRLYEERRLSSITDLLTGLLNRRGLLERIEPMWPGLIGRRIAFVCIDMDHLKQINDTYGHSGGDRAIRLVGQAIREALPSGASAARIGGDEFVVFIPEGERAKAMIQDFEDALTRLNEAEDLAFTVTASVGLADKRMNDKDTIEKYIQIGDKAMYRAKEAHHMNRTN